MASEKLIYEATLEDNVTSKAKAMAGGLGDLAKTAKACVGAFLAFEGVKVATDFLGKAYDEAKQAEIATQKLTAALGKQSKALKEQADALQFKSRAEDDEITAMQAALASYVKSEDAILKLTPAILDMAEATGMDLKSAAMQVGRAIADDAEEMGRYKIKVDGAAGSSERATSVMEGLTQKFGGQSGAANKAAGEVENLGKAWNNFLGDIGAKITPSLERIAKAARESLFSASVDERRALEIRVEAAQANVAATDRMWRDSNKQKKARMAEAQFDVDVAKSLLAEYDAIKKKSSSGDTGKITDLTPDQRAAADAAKEAGEKAAKIAREVAAQRQADAEAHVILMNEIHQRGLDESAQADKEANDKAKAEGDAFRARQLMLKEKFYEQDAAAKLKAEQKKAQYERQTFDQAVGIAQSTADLMGQMANLSKEDAKKMQGLRIGQALVDAAAASVAMWRSVWTGAGNPYVAIALGVVNQAAIIASTAANISQIKSQKFADGGIVAGPSGGDTVGIRANGGEMMINREQQANLFSMLNGSGGGGGGMTINAGITINGGSGGLTASDLRRAQTQQERMIKDTMRRMVNRGQLSQAVFA